MFTFIFFVFSALPLLSNCGKIVAVSDSGTRHITPLDYTEFCQSKLQDDRSKPTFLVFPPPDVQCPRFTVVCFSNGTVYLGQCPAGYMYSTGACRPSTLTCDYLEVVNCSAGALRRMVPNGCSNNFFWCWDGELSIHTCNPPHLYYNPDNGQCDYYANVELCSGNKVEASTPSQAIFSDDRSPPPVDEHLIGYCQEKEDGDYPHPEYVCAQYFITCSNRRTFFRYCSSPLYFDSELMVCERPQYIPACGGVRLPQTAADSFFCQEANGTFVDPVYPPCSEYYYECRNSRSEKLRCGKGRAFNPRTSKCALKRFVIGCDPGFCDRRANGVYAVPHTVSICNSVYLECVDTRSYLRPCPMGMVFNSNTKACDFPEHVFGCDTDPTFENNLDTNQSV